MLATPDTTLGAFLQEHPALALEPLTNHHLDLRVANIAVDVVEPTPSTRLFLPGVSAAGLRSVAPDAAAPGLPATGAADEPVAAQRLQPDGDGHPSKLSEREAVLLAHHADIDRAADYLASALSVLVRCEKLLVEHIAGEIAARSGRDWNVVRIPAEDDRSDAVTLGSGGPNRRSALVAALQSAVAETSDGAVVVVPHLDLLAGGNDQTLSSEARDLTDLLYERSECVLLAFVDPSLIIPDVLANRFAVRRAIDILPRELIAGDGTRVPVGRALVTSDEAKLFRGFNGEGLYKHVAGMNAVRLRHALQFAHHQYRDAETRPDFDQLQHELREFKVQTSSDSFEVPNTTFDDIGGYEEVKDELRRAIEIINGAAAGIDPKLRPHLVPRGYIFYGPPGTGKTLFAKAIAAELGGTILVVSGPEITDKYVGESERKVRDVFAQARRNAPSVVVFDEFDSIAARRTGRDDGGSRAGNAIVAQLLTELDGFRAEVPVMIIGTTNRYDLIDEALLRPSRFRGIGIGLPNKAARFQIATRHAKDFGYTLEQGLLDLIAEATDGMNGDEIASIFRDALADELVGSRVPADAYRFGHLVGTLRRSTQARAIERAKATGRASGSRNDRTTFVDLPRRQPPGPANARPPADAGVPAT